MQGNHRVDGQGQPGPGGQSCIAARRFVVEEPVADEFERRFVDAVAALPVGDPLDPATRVGPLARADLLDALERQVEGSVAGGAKVLLGGARLERPGWYYAPTVLAGVTPDLPVFTEETFARSRPSSAPPTRRPRSSWPTTPPASWPRSASGSSPTSAPSGSSPPTRPRPRPSRSDHGAAVGPRRRSCAAGHPLPDGPAAAAGRRGRARARPVRCRSAVPELGRDPPDPVEAAA
ncbi:MAG TPA: aldehyde dehydrogenase family protein [Actinomycetes bacterium]|nr:aldehyde dehydrogenase family protein [Actinomycetes bacterium]